MKVSQADEVARLARRLLFEERRLNVGASDATGLGHDGSLGRVDVDDHRPGSGKPGPAPAWTPGEAAGLNDQPGPTGPERDTAVERPGDIRAQSESDLKPLASR